MNKHERFNFKGLDDLKEKINSLGLQIPISENLESLAQPVKIGETTIANAISVHPMEGCDGTAEGAPDELPIDATEDLLRVVPVFFGLKLLL